MASWFAALVLIALIVGSLMHNSIVLKSARTTFRIDPEQLSETVSGLIGPVVMTGVAFLLGWAALDDIPANYEGFVMVLGYLICPWLNVLLIDQFIRRKSDVSAVTHQRSLSYKWGLFSIAFAVIGSACIWALQVVDAARLPSGISYEALGLLVGFYLAGAVYAFGLKKMIKEREAAALAESGQ